MTNSSITDELGSVVEKARKICNRIMLFEAVQMEESEVRLFLDCNHVSNNTIQNDYLELVRKYGRVTNCRQSRKIG
jgi:hypothetical protein